MDNNNKNKYALLGEPFGTANNKLRKAIMFQLIQKLNLDVCYRCGQKINDIQDLSVEHKIPWQSSENPKEMFYALDNIAFSHLNCNIRASDQRNKFVAQMRKVPEGYSYCFGCKQVLSEDNFWKDSSRLCGKQYRCKNCIKRNRENDKTS